MLPAKTDPRLYVKSLVPCSLPPAASFCSPLSDLAKGLTQGCVGGGRGGTPCFHIAAAAAALPSRRGSTQQPTWQWQREKEGRGKVKFVEGGLCPSLAGGFPARGG